MVRKLLMFLLVAAVYIGANQLSSNNNVFANTMALCCNNGLCHDMPCSGKSSILPCSGSEYITTCMMCMEVVYELDACYKYNGPWPTWCVMSNGNRYYP